MAIRSFIALEPSEAVERILRQQLMRYRESFPRGINWVSPENLHLTLLFLGDIAPETVPELKQALLEACRRLPPFKLELVGMELFPHSAPRIIWAKLRSEGDEIFKLSRKLLYFAKELGLEPDTKDLRLHITLGRIKDNPGPQVEREILQTPIALPASSFDTVSLYKSVLRPQGPVYEALHQVKLLNYGR